MAAILAAALLHGPVARGQLPAPPARTEKPGEREKDARRTFDQGQLAEGAGEWARAFELYSLAASRMPGVGEYLMRREAARFQVIQQHVDRAERAAVEGKLDAARGELKAALALDPSYDVARERLAQLERRPAAARPSEPSAQVVQLQPREGLRNFDFRGDTRGAYEEVARKFGLTASFDGDVRGREIRFRTQDVDFATAMRVLGQQTDTFYVALDPKTFFVADDSPQKRRELAPVVLQTISLAGFASPEDMTEIVRLVREIAGITRTQLDTRTRTLTVRDTPEAVALAMKLVKELEQAAGELMLEVEILEVDRNLTRRLGVTPPSSARTITISPDDIREAQQSPEGLLRVLQRLFGTGLGSFTGNSSLGPLIPPLIALGGGRSVLLATLPGATAEFAETLAALRGARRMMLRALDGEQATFFIGERFPVALAVLSPNFAGVSLGSVGSGSLLRKDLPASDGPTAVAVADFNGVGVPDLAVANANANSVSIFLGNGDGTFADPTDIAVGTAPSAIVATDFDADGQQDLAVTNETSNTVSILLGNGDGTFDAPVAFAVGTGPRGMVTADFNGDNQPDLAVTNTGNGTVTILLNAGSGAFVAQPPINAGAGPRGIVAADFDGDAIQDLAVANENDATVLLFFGVGDGTFAGGAGFQTGTAPVAITSADLNVDGFQDLLVANQGDDTVSVYLGVGDGTFPTVSDFTVGDAPSAIAVADFTADGRLDAAVTNFNDDSFTILLGAGDGSFAARADFQVGDGPTAVIAPDLTGDGRRDLVVTNREGDTVAVVVNQTSITPAPPFGSQSVQPYPGFQYEDLGLKVRATPRMHRGGEVTLQLQIEIRSRTGQELNGIPVISNRTVEQTLRVKENERTLLTGIIQRGETRGLLGWPGLVRLPATGRRSKEDRETELILSITPRRLRLADRIDRQYYAGRDTGRGTAGPTPQPPQ